MYCNPEERQNQPPTQQPVADPAATQKSGRFLPLSVAPKEKGAELPFVAGRADGLFAISCLVLGFLFVRWGLKLQGWGVTAFTWFYGAGVLAYCAGKNHQPKASSWYWLAIMLLCGSCYALWPAGSMAFWQALLLLASGIYWTGSLFGMLIEGKTGNLLPWDGLNLVLLVPLKNIGCLLKSLQSLGGAGRLAEGQRSRIRAIILGIALSVPLLLLVVPGLIRADSANFGRLVQSLLDFLDGRFWGLDLGQLFGQWILGIPVGMYMCGLVAGGAHRRHVNTIDAHKVYRQMAAVRITPEITLVLVIGIVSVVYVVFIGCQLPYFFSAFAGVRPEGYEVYSAYAREGFFELCRIAALNLGLIAMTAVLGRRPADESPALRLMNLILCAMTLLVIATAFSKMGLYIKVYGFTPKRVMTCMFMLFLAGVCVAVMIRQFRKFSVVRTAAVWGTGLLCALCLCCLDGTVVRQNAERYLAGSLAVFDESQVMAAGVAGFAAGYEVYSQMSDQEGNAAKEQLGDVLWQIQRHAATSEGSSTDHLAAALVRKGEVIPR